MKAYQHERIKADRTRGTISARTRTALTERRSRARVSTATPNYGKWALILGVVGLGYFITRKAAAQTPLLPPSNGIAVPQGPQSYSPLPIQAGTQNIPELPATMAPTGGEIAASGSFWDNLQPVQSLSSGYINFPSGAQSAATLFPTRMDANGQYYVQWAGLVYVLGSQDSSGNWPAQAVG